MSGIQFAYYGFHPINIRESLYSPSFFAPLRFPEIRGSLHCNGVCRFPFLPLLLCLPLLFSLSFSMLFRQSLIFRLQLHVDGGTAPAFITRAQSICIFSSAFYANMQRPTRCREYVGDHISFGKTQQRGLFVIILHIIPKELRNILMIKSIN